MTKDEIWSTLEKLGVYEQTLQIITDINGYSEDTLYAILYAYTGYRNFNQMKNDPAYADIVADIDDIEACGSIAASTYNRHTPDSVYLYIFKHGIGPGTMPSDVNIVKVKDLPNYYTAVWLDRFLTTDEMKQYDIPFETDINYYLDRIGYCQKDGDVVPCDDVEACDTVMASADKQGVMKEANYLFSDTKFPDGIVLTWNGAADLERKGISGYFVWVGYKHPASGRSVPRMNGIMYDVAKDMIAPKLEETFGGEAHIDDFIKSVDMYRVWIETYDVSACDKVMASQRFEVIIKRYGKPAEEEIFTEESQQALEDKLNNDGYIDWWDYSSGKTYDPWETVNEVDDEFDDDGDVEACDKVTAAKTIRWSQLSDSDQFAVEHAISYLDSNYGGIENVSNDDYLRDAARYGCNIASEGNAEPEYENEDFYMDEPDFDKVFNYLKSKSSCRDITCATDIDDDDEDKIYWVQAYLSKPHRGLVDDFATNDWDAAIDKLVEFANNGYYIAFDNLASGEGYYYDPDEVLEAIDFGDIYTLRRLESLYEGR